MKILLVGGGAREHAIAKALKRSEGVTLFVFSKNKNPGLVALASEYGQGDENDPRVVAEFARRVGAEAACIGPEAPLAAGVSDALREAGLLVAAPSKAAAEIETSKVFMRRLLERYRLKGSLQYHFFDDAEMAKKHLSRHGLRWAIKPVGLTGGKGVRVFGDHFKTFPEAAAYIDEVARSKQSLLLEELAEGEEFTLQAFADGAHLVPTIAVQDHKRLLPDDQGPNTGGMGSYSQSDGLLPFLPAKDWEEALGILGGIVTALKQEGRAYHGPIYGQFMLTLTGPKLIEVNARFGDPEAMNVLELLQSDYGDLVARMAEGRLVNSSVRFDKMATVVKYVVPEGYGTTPKGGSEVRVDEAAITRSKASLYYANVDAVRAGVVRTTTSRSVAVLGRGETLREANDACEAGLKHVKGPGLFVRHDIGTTELIQSRLKHMAALSKGA